MAGTTDVSAGRWFGITLRRVVRDAGMACLIIGAAYTFIVRDTGLEVTRTLIAELPPEKLVEMASIGLMASTLPMMIITIAMISFMIRISIASAKQIMKKVAERRAAAGVSLHV